MESKPLTSPLSKYRSHIGHLGGAAEFTVFGCLLDLSYFKSTVISVVHSEQTIVAN